MLMESVNSEILSVWSTPTACAASVNPTTLLKGESVWPIWEDAKSRNHTAIAYNVKMDTD